jgi:hypothetical protein
MCEFCRNPSSNSDANHIDFQGFFSASAIEAAVSTAARQSRRKIASNEDEDAANDDGDDDSDGT